MKENLFEVDKIRLYSGAYIDPLNYSHKSGLIKTIDIAKGLAHTNRWAGQTQYPVSVAEHSLQCYHYFINKYSEPGKLSAIDFELGGIGDKLLQILLHDAAEPFLGEVPKPVKDRFPEYREAENRLLVEIWQQFGVQNLDYYPETKEIDLISLEWEWERYMLLQLDPGVYPEIKAGQYVEILEFLIERRDNG